MAPDKINAVFCCGIDSCLCSKNFLCGLILDRLIMSVKVIQSPSFGRIRGFKFRPDQYILQIFIPPIGRYKPVIREESVTFRAAKVLLQPLDKLNIVFRILNNNREDRVQAYGFSIFKGSQCFAQHSKSVASIA